LLTQRQHITSRNAFRHAQLNSQALLQTELQKAENAPANGTFDKKLLLLRLRVPSVLQVHHAAASASSPASACDTPADCTHKGCGEIALSNISSAALKGMRQIYSKLRVLSSESEILI
jgi:hypothetical protein